MRAIIKTLPIAIVVAVSLSGCAAAVDKSEVEQKANPVKELHEGIQKQKEAEMDALRWYSYEDALVKARKEGKFVMVDFYAVWCHWCKELDKNTYSDPKVVEALNADFVAVKVNAESDKPVVHEMRQMTMSQLKDLYGVEGYPSVWFLDKDGKKVKLLDGYLPPKEFSAYLRYVKEGAYRDMEFEQYYMKTKGGTSK